MTATETATASGTLADGTVAAVHLKQLMSDRVHREVLWWLDNRVPMLPISYDHDEFQRGWLHNPDLLVHLHRKLTPFASDLFGEPVKPTYVGLSMYNGAGVCPLHIDRPQCRYTIDWLIRDTMAERWPIYVSDQLSQRQRELSNGHPEDDESIRAVKDTQTWHRVDKQPNDAIAFSGTHSWHYRDPIPGGTADLAFFHFVPVDFEGGLN